MRVSELFILRLVRFPYEFPEHRRWLLFLALSWVFGLVTLVALAVFSHAISYLNAWTWLWRSALDMDPSAWIFLLADARLPGLFFCALLGVLFGALTGRSLIGWALTPAALFAGVVSLPGAWVIILSERLAVWIRAWFANQDPRARREVAFRGAIALMVWFLTLSLGPWGRLVMQEAFASSTLDPEIRFVQFACGLAAISVFETALAMIFFHFYHAKTKVRPA